ncbi:MAG TPA: LptF/LptG family permease [Gemmatimonadaceae bacterium]|nr:LptF/LptG family permease [Gemmatimonadaceae bacterium]
MIGRLGRRIFRPLDRYVFSEFFRIFFTTALGFPLIVIIIDLTDNLDRYLARDLPKSQIAMSYVYWIPDSMFMVLPAAVLFATVFTIGGFTRYSEITAAKASGISFHRFAAPIWLGAAIGALLALGLGELAPRTNALREEMLETRRFQRGTDRYNFVFAADEGRNYKVTALNVLRSSIDGVEIERKGNGPEYPTTVIAATAGTWEETEGWTLRTGWYYVLPDSARTFAFRFDSLVDNQLRERPMDLMATPKAPQDMGFRELGRFIRAMERSGADVRVMKVERMLKLAIPVTCIVIALFGAPLATSSQRGGAAYGIGVSLGTTVVFLMLIQLTKAIGGRGVLDPETAAWTPNIIFAVVGLYLLTRVKT